MIAAKQEKSKISRSRKILPKPSIMTVDVVVSLGKKEENMESMLKETSGGGASEFPDLYFFISQQSNQDMFL